MLTVFVADIFGHTAALSQLAEEVIGPRQYLIIDAYSRGQEASEQNNGF